MPLSEDPEARERQLANLRPGAGAWRPGAAPHLRHGLRSRRPGPLTIGPAMEEHVKALEDVVPLRGPDGDVLPQFRAAIQAVALMAVQIERCRGFLATHGHEDERGRWRPENDQLDKKLAQYLNALGQLGATPTSYARLGFDVAAAERAAGDVALRWAREDNGG